MQEQTEATADAMVNELEAKAARFAPVDLTADISGLPDTERQVLRLLIEASRLVDALFVRQVWAGNEAMLLGLAHDASPVGRARLRYFLLYDSDVAWMELDASIEPTIGPYEVYEDEWFNYKAAFESFITVRDDVETAKLERTRDIMTLQATGDYQAAKSLIDTLGVVRPPVQTILDRLDGVPVDIAPRFVTADELLAAGQ